MHNVVRYYPVAMHINVLAFLGPVIYVALGAERSVVASIPNINGRLSEIDTDEWNADCGGALIIEWAPDKSWVCVGGPKDLIQQIDIPRLRRLIADALLTDVQTIYTRSRTLAVMAGKILRKTSAAA